MIEAQSETNERDRASRWESRGVTAVVALGCALVLGSLLGGLLWALDDTYVGSGGPISFRTRLQYFLSMTMSNTALSSLVLAVGLYLQHRLRRATAPAVNHPDSEVSENQMLEPMSIDDDGGSVEHDLWRPSTK